MSRIDEALRRAAEEQGEERPGVDPSIGDEWATQQYPLERTPAVRRAERVAPLHHTERTRVSPAAATGIEARASDSVVPGRLVVHESASQILIEQYRRLAAVLHEAQAERQLKTLAVTSSLPREGKTLTVANLALTLSESYARRVLLIDADLRRPSAHQLFGVSASTGLTDVLRSSRRELNLVEISPHLSLLPAGRSVSNPLAALSSERMRELLQECANQFDWVLLDTPPVGLLSDAQVVSRLVGAVVFVIGAGSTPFPVVDRAISELGRECIIGTVLNRIDESAIPETSYYGDYYDSGTAGSRP
jgi:protein-tyrosine kinase